MKNREEYIASIYAKRNEKLAKRNKAVSMITSIACLTICFIAIFSFVPKKFNIKTSTIENVNENSLSNSQTINEIIPEDKTMLDQFGELLKFESAYVVNESVNPATNSIDSNVKDGLKNENGREDSLKTEIAAETPVETTRQINFGYVGEPFDPDKLLSGETAIAPADPSDDFGEPATEPSETENGVKATKASTTAAKLRTSEEAVEEAKKIVPEEDASKIIDDKTQVTISRTASGKSTYTVYFYTNYKSYAIELDAVTLNLIECKTKNLVTGDTNHYSPAHFPETTEALPEYKPQ